MIKAKYKPLYLFVLLLLVITNARAQHLLVYKITGTVIDSASQRPVELITVRLKSDDGKIVSNTLTDLKGTFAFTKIIQGRYTLALSGIGYHSAEIKTAIIDQSSKTIDFKNIMITKQVSGLKDVVIAAQKPLIRQEADRIIYDLQADPDSKANNLLGIMRKIPFLSVDGNDNLLLKGQADYKVFINGKPSSMMERNLTAVLRSMPASIIQKIEVITNPSSRYDAEGLAGIINIITIKNTGNDYNGTVNLSERHPVGGPVLSGSFNARQNKIDITGFGGAGIYNKPQTENAISRVTTNGLNTVLLQNGKSKSSVPSGYFGSEISYSIDTLNLISGQVNVNGDRTQESIEQLSNLIADIAVSERYNLYTDNLTSSSGWDAGLNYQRGFKANKNRLFTLAYRYLTYQNRLNSDVTLTNRFNYSIPDYQQNNNGRLNEHTLQADYIHPLKVVAIESGIKGIIRHNESAYNFLTAGTAALVANNYSNNQYIWAAYNSYQFLLKGWRLKAGFRAELTAINADFVSNAMYVNQHYVNLIPNLAASKKINDYSSFNLGFSQRIKRPGINRLNPFVDRSNPSFEVSGNPALKPSIINNLQIGYNGSYKAEINVGASYSWVKDISLQVTSFNKQTQITRTTYENIGKARALDGNWSVSYAISKVWNASLNAHASIIWLNALNNEESDKNRWIIYNGALSSSYNLSNNWRVTANLNIISRSIVNLQGTTNGLISSSLSVNKDLIKNKLSFAVSLNNPFNKYRNNITETTGTGFVQTALTRNYFRQYNVSLNYRFGKLKEAVKKAKRGIKNDDLSN